LPGISTAQIRMGPICIRLMPWVRTAKLLRLGLEDSRAGGQSRSRAVHRIARPGVRGMDADPFAAMLARFEGLYPIDATVAFRLRQLSEV
jgi:hypothetical protein